MKPVIVIFFFITRLSTFPLTIGLGRNLQLEQKTNYTDFTFILSPSHDPYYEDSFENLVDWINVQKYWIMRNSKI